MKPNRPFYIALTCLVATLFWTIAAGVVTPPNQTMHNRPNTVLVYHPDDFENYPLDPQLKSVWIIRPIRMLEYAAYGLAENRFNWVRTADVIKSFEADWLADSGLPTGVWRKMDFEADYACYAEPLNVKGNTIRYRVKGSRHGGYSDHQLTLTVNRHDTRKAAKERFIETVKTLYKKINWGLEMESDIEQKIRHELFFYENSGLDNSVWQERPDPNFTAHTLNSHHWTTPLNHEEVGPRGYLSIRREPLTENGYKWGDPFVIRVLISSYAYP